MWIAGLPAAVCGWKLEAEKHAGDNPPAEPGAGYNLAYTAGRGIIQCIASDASRRSIFAAAVFLCFYGIGGGIGVSMPPAGYFLCAQKVPKDAQEIDGFWRHFLHIFCRCRQKVCCRRHPKRKRPGKSPAFCLIPRKVNLLYSPNSSFAFSTAATVFASCTSFCRHRRRSSSNGIRSTFRNSSSSGCCAPKVRSRARYRYSTSS